MNLHRSRPIALDEVEARFDLRSWVEQNLTIASKSGSEYTCICPLCGKAKLAVNIHRKAYQCWYAGCKLRGWSPTLLVADVLGVSYADACAIVGALAGGVQLGPVRDLEGNERSHARRVLPEAPLPPGVVWQLTGRAYRYARERGITPENMRSFQIGYVEGDGSRSKADRTFRDRLLFPVLLHGRVVYWAARALTDDRIKVVNLPKACKEPEAHEADCTCYHEEWGLPPVPQVAQASEVVLGLHLMEKGGHAIAVEGPVDAAVCGPGFVCMFGAHASRLQAFAISAIAAKVSIVFDGDEAGHKGLFRAERMFAGMDHEALVCPPDQDPGELGRAKVMALIEENRSHAGTIAPLGIRSDETPERRQQLPWVRPLRG